MKVVETWILCSRQQRWHRWLARRRGNAATATVAGTAAATAAATAAGSRLDEKVRVQHQNKRGVRPAASEAERRDHSWSHAWEHAFKFIGLHHGQRPFRTEQSPYVWEVDCC